MLIRPAIGDTDPIRYRRPNPDGQLSGNIIDDIASRMTPKISELGVWRRNRMREKPRFPA